MLRLPRALAAGASGSMYGLTLLVVAAGMTFRVVPALAESGTTGPRCDVPAVVACQGKGELARCEGCGTGTCGCLASGCTEDGGRQSGIRANVCFAIHACDDPSPQFVACDGKREGEACEGTTAGPSVCAPGPNCLEGLVDGTWQTLRPRLTCGPGMPTRVDAGSRDAEASSSAGSDSGSPPSTDDGCSVGGAGVGLGGALSVLGSAVVAFACALRRRAKRRA